MRENDKPPADLPRNWRAVVVPAGNYQGRKLGELSPQVVKTLVRRGGTAWLREICQKAVKEMGIE